MNIDLAAMVPILRRGGVVLLPTDTIYGLHALASDKKAVDRIAALKDRKSFKPFVVLGASIEQLEDLGAQFTARTRSALAELWPGPLTAVVPLTKTIPASRGAMSLAVRVPDFEPLRDLIRQTGPLVSTSANRSGEPPLVSPEEMSSELRRGVDAVVDAGSKIGKPSTIVDFTGDEPRVLREGESLFTQKVWKTLRKSL